RDFVRAGMRVRRSATRSMRKDNRGNVSSSAICLVLRLCDDEGTSPDIRASSSSTLHYRNKACHPEAGEARRGTSRALTRLRKFGTVYAMVTPPVACVTKLATARSLA